MGLPYAKIIPPITSLTSLNMAQSTRTGNSKTSCMQQWIKDTVVLGIGLWLIGYLASLVLFFSPYAGTMGWILLVIFTPITIAVTWWWFRQRKDLSLEYYVKVGMAWVLIAIVFDYLFIVQLFQATYYDPDVFVYYAMTFLIPVGVGLYLIQNQNKV